MPLSISFSRIMLSSFCRWGDRSLNDTLEFNSRILTKAYEAFDQCSVAIENKRLRNILIVAEETIHQFVVGKRELILDAKFLCIRGHLSTIVCPSNIQADDLKALLCVLPLHLDKLRCFCPAGLAPGRVKIQQHNLALVVR